MVKERLVDQTMSAIRPAIKREFMKMGKNTMDHAIEIERETILRTREIKRMILGD